MDKDNICLLMVCPRTAYFEKELETSFTVFKLWEIEDKNHFFNTHGNSIRAVVGSGRAGPDAHLIQLLPKLEIVAIYGVGMDKTDLVRCKEKGIIVTNTFDATNDDVADLAIGLILGVLRRICESDRYVRSGNWKKGDYELTTKFSGKSVGIIGMGRIGTAIAKRAEGFSCNISYHSRTEKPNLNYKYFPNVIELASNCEILVLSCSLTAQTKHIVNQEVIDALGQKGVLINIGRGGLVDEPELVSALVEGRLGGAGLDVFEHEPEAPEELFGLDNVVLLPHAGPATVETRKLMADLVIGNLKAYFSNQPLLTPVV